MFLEIYKLSVHLYQFIIFSSFHFFIIISLLYLITPFSGSENELYLIEYSNSPFSKNQYFCNAHLSSIFLLFLYNLYSPCS